MKNFDIVKLVDKALDRFQSLAQITDTLADFIAPKTSASAAVCAQCLYLSVGCGDWQCKWNGSSCQNWHNGRAYHGQASNNCLWKSCSTCSVWGSSCSGCITP